MPLSFKRPNRAGNLATLYLHRGLRSCLFRWLQLIILTDSLSSFHMNLKLKWRKLVSEELKFNLKKSSSSAACNIKKQYRVDTQVILFVPYYRDFEVFINIKMVV